MNKSKIIFSLFIVFLLSLFICKANIQVFEYANTENEQKIISLMEASIKEFDFLEYNAQRLVDILDEARYYSGKDKDKFFETAGLFRNTTLQVFSIAEDYSLINKTLDLFSELSVNVSQETADSLKEAYTYLIQGEYEKSETLIIKIKSTLKETADILYSEAFAKADGLDGRLKELVNNSSILADIKAQIKIDKEQGNLDDIKSVLDEIKELDDAINKISEIKTHMLFFYEKNISIARVKDIFDESLYYLEKKRYEKIDELYMSSKKLYESAKNYEKNYGLLVSDLKTISSASSDQKVTGFIESLESSHKLYLNSDFEGADSSLQELEKNIIDYRSENIALNFVGFNRLSIFQAIRDNILIIIIVIISIVLLLIFSWKPLLLLYTKKMMRKHEKKKESLINVMKELQEKYFIKKIISKKSYEYQIKIYQKSFVEITRKIALLKEKSNINKK